MWHVYILYNSTIDRYYIGFTSDLDERVTQHNRGSHSSKYTRKQPGNWELVHKEKFNSKSEAQTREKEIKKKKSKRYIKMLIEQSRQ